MTIPDMHELLRLHMEGSARIRELMEQCRQLRDTGKTGEARKIFAQIEEIRARLTALEDQVRPKRPEG